MNLKEGAGSKNGYAGKLTFVRTRSIKQSIVANINKSRQNAMVPFLFIPVLRHYKSSLGLLRRQE